MYSGSYVKGHLEKAPLWSLLTIFRTKHNSQNHAENDHMNFHDTFGTNIEEYAEKKVAFLF